MIEGIFAEDALAAIFMPVELLRYIAFSHFEADECGALNDFLAVAPRAMPVGSRTAIMVSVNDFANRPGRPLADGEVIELGRHAVRWFDTPHLPHGWETGYFFESWTEPCCAATSSRSAGPRLRRSRSPTF